jgi:hypothetical protein
MGVAGACTGFPSSHRHLVNRYVDRDIAGVVNVGILAR